MDNVETRQVFNEIKAIILKLQEAWDISEELSPDTLFFEDLGFESIDLVVFASMLEEHFHQSFPFADFLTELGEQQATDVRISQVVDFIMKNLGTGKPKEG